MVIIWIDAHPDVSTTEDGYPNAHAMVLGSLLGYGASQLSEQMENKRFKADEVMYVGLQPLHEYQENFLKGIGDGSGGGKMTMESAAEVLKVITEESDVVGFTIAEYLPFDEHKLHKMFSEIKLFTEYGEVFG
ncbi:arginase family protein [Emergencia sp.]|uniref:arginase family protein n=1 Tax=Emergencia sp. TaxID=1926557 RepID=UPI003AF0A201